MDYFMLCRVSKIEEHFSRNMAIKSLQQSPPLLCPSSITLMRKKKYQKVKKYLRSVSLISLFLNKTGYFALQFQILKVANTLGISYHIWNQFSALKFFSFLKNSLIYLFFRQFMTFIGCLGCMGQCGMKMESSAPCLFCRLLYTRKAQAMGSFWQSIY